MVHRLPTLYHSGVKLILDIGVLDVTTCEPLPNAFVEIWSGTSHYCPTTAHHYLNFNFSQRYWCLR